MWKWKISGRELPDQIIVAGSFDEAILEARRIDENYSTGQVVEYVRVSGGKAND